MIGCIISNVITLVENIYYGKITKKNELLKRIIENHNEFDMYSDNPEYLEKKLITVYKPKEKNLVVYWVKFNLFQFLSKFFFKIEI